MSSRTTFLSRLIGLYCIVVALSFITQKETSVGTVNTLVHDPALLLILGVVTLAMGLAIILGHNVWSGGALPVVVTLLGWITLVKGLLFLFLPPETIAYLLRTLQYEQRFYLYSGLSLVIGLYLTYGGFRSGSHRIAPEGGRRVLVVRNFSSNEERMKIADQVAEIAVSPTMRDTPVASASK